MWVCMRRPRKLFGDPILLTTAGLWERPENRRREIPYAADRAEDMAVLPTGGGRLAALFEADCGLLWAHFHSNPFCIDIKIWPQ